jgi:hypothetical protein
VLEKGNIWCFKGFDGYISHTIDPILVCVQLLL